MTNITKRIERVEERLSMDRGREPIVHEIVCFGNGPLPPDERRAGAIVQYVRYTDLFADKDNRDE